MPDEGYDVQSLFDSAGTGVLDCMTRKRTSKKNIVENQNGKIGALFRIRCQQSAILKKRRAIQLDYFEKNKLHELNSLIDSMYSELLALGISSEKVASRMRTLEARESRRISEAENELRSKSMRSGAAGIYGIGNTVRHWK